jgi:hypothetical protein
MNELHAFLMQGPPGLPGGQGHIAAPHLGIRAAHAGLWAILFYLAAMTALLLAFHFLRHRGARRGLAALPLAFLLASVAAFPPTQGPAGVAGGTGHSTTLTWVASTSANVTGYWVYGASVSGGEAGTTPLNATQVTALTFVDTTVTAGASRCYVVVATDAAGDLSPFSNEACATTPAGNVVNPPPGAPTVVAK